MTPSIMLVDDDDDIREIVGLILQAEGYHTVDAADGAQALALLSEDHEPPPLILLDMMMPVLNGAEFLRKVKSDEHLRDIPIVVMSGDTAARKTASTLGAEGCVSKPVELDVILDYVHRFAPLS